MIYTFCNQFKKLTTDGDTCTVFLQSDWSRVMLLLSSSCFGKLLLGNAKKGNWQHWLGKFYGLYCSLSHTNVRGKGKVDTRSDCYNIPFSKLVSFKGKRYCVNHICPKRLYEEKKVRKNCVTWRYCYAQLQSCIYRFSQDTPGRKLVFLGVNAILTTLSRWMLEFIVHSI